MSINFKWSIVSMETFSDVNGLSSVVRDVQWKVTAVKDGIKKEVSAFVRLPPPSNPSFIDYDNLTEPQLIEWVKAHIDVQAIENSLLTQFSSGTTTKRMPWKFVEDDFSDIIPMTPNKQ